MEELKSVWASIDGRLGKQEAIKENIIREMIRDRSNRSLGKLMNYEILCVAIYLIAIPLVVSQYYFKPLLRLTGLAGNVFLWAMLAICVASLAWTLFKIVALMKVDFMKSVKANALLINRYRLWIQKEKLIGFAVEIPAVVFIVVWLLVSIQANALQWITLVCALLLGIFLSFYTYYRGVYDRHIATIRRSLEELKELEEELP
ncbi:MAG: hypothetical protein LBJ01_03685 [Tannerella sp.]|nr:hypothetical protein [Tannerella sp.]